MHAQVSKKLPTESTERVRLLADGTIALQLDVVLAAQDTFINLTRQKHCVFFDSSMQLPSLGRYSFLSADPICWYSGASSDFDPTLIASDCRPDLEFELPPFRGGWAGAWGYHLNQTIENVPSPGRNEFEIPDFAFGFYDFVIAWDHQLKRCWLIANGRPEVEIHERRKRAWERISEVLHWLNRSPDSAPKPVGAESLHLDQLLAVEPIKDIAEVYSNVSRQDYLEAVQKCIDYIWAGDVFQVNLSQRLIRLATTDPVTLFLKSRKHNPAPFSAFFDLGDHQLISASPERFLKIDQGKIETRPIKGTCLRTGNKKLDQLAIQELQSSRKDRAENTMIVDLLRNDLSKVAEDESVNVTQLCQVEAYQSVFHLVSVINARIRSDCSFTDIFSAVFPGGSITGAPKIRAMEIIAELEPTSRGFYCGSIGYFGIDGQMDSNILIRTISASKGWWQFPVGGGIVAQSNPQAEYQETMTKALGMLNSMQSLR